MKPNQPKLNLFSHPARIFSFALLCFALTLFSSPARAIVITDNATPAQLSAALQGAGITSITNMQIVNNGCANRGDAIGLFSQGTTPTGLGPVLGDASGIVLATGAMNPPNQADPLASTNDDPRWDQGGGGLCGASVSDPDMVLLEPQTAAGEYIAIEFDIVPQFNTMAIPFQFGSDEFPEYVCSAFNDVTGIFVSGPGIAGPYSNGAENFAKTPAGDLTSINWVNTGVVGQNGNIANCGSLTNTAYYTDNSNGDLFGGNATVATTNQNLELDGWTNYIYQPFTVVPGQTYHVKAVIADAGDLQWDSAVFFHLIFSSNSILGFDFGDAPDTYRTLTANGGPRHGINANLYIGTTQPDDEVTGQPTVGADGDDTSTSDDEDGVASFATLETTATGYSVDVTVTNNIGTDATLFGWIDFDGNGTFETSEGVTTTVSDGTTGGNATLNWTGLSGLAAGQTYARFRLTTDTNITTATPGGSASDGEVEDYTLTIIAPDLSTSTKSVVDLNGGNADPGDTLRYTITLIESNGVAVNSVSVTDDIPANANNFSVVSIPGGAADSSTGAGTGANGNGYLDIGNISIPASGSVTVVFDVDVNGPIGSSVDNTATITNPYGPGATPAAPTVNIGAVSDFSTSTKSVVDINGGDAAPDDTLRYTITLIESSGNPGTVSVTDDIPANVNSFTVISTPAGATDSSTGAGTGANGTGYLDISSITVPGSGTATVIFDVTIDSAAAPGTLIDNTATITNPLGAGATPSAPTVVVSASGIPSSGNKPLYLYGAAGYELSRVPTPGTPADITLNEGVSQTWTLTPALQTPITLSPSVNPNIPVTLYLGETGNQQNRDVNVTLTCVGTGASTNQQQTIDLNPALWVTFNLPFPGGTDWTCPDQWQLTVQNNTTGPGQRAVIVSPVNGGAISQVNLPSLDVINVDSVTFHDVAYPASSPIVNAGPNDTIYIRAVVSDPFGSFDITGATLNLTDGIGTLQVAAGAMTEVNDSGAATKIYEYTYTLPAAPANGIWTASITAAEGTEGTITHTDTGTISVPTPLPNLSTSTKTVADLNGGDAEPGDTLRYTIDIIETGGGAGSNIQVTDTIPANVNSFTVISIPGGATDSSNPTGGANGTGFLNISNISVPAAGTVSIVFDVTIDIAASAGTTIDNTATIFNPTGPGGTPSAPTAIVSASTVPSSGTKPLYLYGAAGFELSRVPTPGVPASITLNEGVAQDWFLTPNLQLPVTISPTVNPNIPITLHLGETGTAQTRVIDVTLTCVGTGTSTNQQQTIDVNPALWVTFNLPFPGGTDWTCPDQWQLTVQNNTTGSGQRAVVVSPVNGGTISQVLLPSLSVINVDNVTIHDAAYPAVSPIIQATGGNTVYIRAVVSDPFGSFDITGATLDLDDGTGTPILTGVAMTEVNDSGGATKTYEYTYTLPALPVTGFWNATVTASEGTEGTITDFGLASFEVPGEATLTILKSADSATAVPGQVITYTITVLNSGDGPATNVQLDDDMSPFISFGVDTYGAGVHFNFIDTPPLTGLSTGTATFSQDNGADGFTYGPTSGAGGAPAGYDGNVTDWILPFTGSMAQGTQFSIEYQVIIK